MGSQAPPNAHSLLLAAHQDADYTEWGASGSVHIEPDASGLGLSLSLSPTWGASAGGVEGLWSFSDARGLAEAVLPAHLPGGRFHGLTERIG